MSKRISPSLLLLTLIVISIPQIVSAQQPEPVIEYGSSADLKGIERIYVYTGTDIELRNQIVKEITKNLKNIIITDTASEAQVCLVYGASIQTFYAGTTTNGTVTDDGNTATGQVRSTPQYRKATYGEGAVVIIKPNSIMRIVMNFKGSKGEGPPLRTLLQKGPTINFARAFVKAYKEANP